MITCPKCGKQLPDGTKFCKYCGNQFAQQTIPANAKKPKKSSKKVAIAIVAVLLVAAIVLGVIFIPKFIDNKKADEAAERLTEILEESTTKPVVEMVCKDYDKNGTYEAYAIVGETDEEDEEHPEFYDADIYFVNEKEAQVIKENVSGKVNGTIDVDKTIYVSIEVYDENSGEGKSFIYTASGDESVETDISGEYSDVHQDGKKIVGTDENGEEVEVEMKSDSSANSEIAKKIKSSKVGDIITFGSYPQTKITDETFLNQLNSKTLEWVSYDFYSGDGEHGSMQPGNWTKYADVEHNGKKYRAVTFSQYRPYYTFFGFDNSRLDQEENGYYVDEIYWFEYEPLEWRVLDPAEGLLLCEYIVDTQAYSNTYYHNVGGEEGEFYSNDAEGKHLSNDYETSSIRAWLNNDFYSIAFNETEKSEILETKIDDSHKDNVFLLNREDASNKSYGFVYDFQHKGDITKSCPEVATSATDYALCLGADNGEWLLRFPAGIGGEGSDTSSASFYPDDNFPTCVPGNVRPALKVDM